MPRTSTRWPRAAISCVSAFDSFVSQPSPTTSTAPTFGFTAKPAIVRVAGGVRDGHDVRHRAPDAIDDVVRTHHRGNHVDVIAHADGTVRAPIPLKRLAAHGVTSAKSPRPRVPSTLW